MSTLCRLIGTTTICYALKQFERVVRCCSNTSKLDVNGELGLTYIVFRGFEANKNNNKVCHALQNGLCVALNAIWNQIIKAVRVEDL